MSLDTTDDFTSGEDVADIGAPAPVPAVFDIGTERYDCVRGVLTGVVVAEAESTD